MKLYYVTAWTGEWAHRRLMFTDKEAAKEYAEFEMGERDVRDVWMTVYDTSRTGSWGSVVMEYNGPMKYWDDNE